MLIFKKNKLNLHEDFNINKNCILQVVNLTKKYFGNKKPSIDNLNFKVFPNTFHAFIGANGAGKTTTIKSIIGAYVNFSGMIYIDKISNREVSSRKIIAYIPEVACFPSGFTVEEYLMAMGELSKIPRNVLINKIDRFLIKFNMQNFRSKFPNNFSSGQKKKIILIQALLSDPKILIMDEPTANLDPPARYEFFNILKDLHKQQCTIFISSHILTELTNFVDSVTIIDKGKIIVSDTISNLIKKQFGTSLIYCLSTNNNDLVLDIIKENKFISLIDNPPEEKEVIKFKAENDIALEKLLKLVISKDIYIKYFKPIVYTLEDIYKKFVKITL